VIRAPIRPRAISPPTTPPTIAGILVLDFLRELPEREVGDERDFEVTPESNVLEVVGGREDSTPLVL